MLFRQEDHADAVFAQRRQLNALLGHLFAVERVRQLNQDARAVTHQLVGPHGTAMIQVFQDLECALHDVMGFDALDVRHESNATGVMLAGA